MSAFLQHFPLLRVAVIAIAIVMMLPIATPAGSSRKDDDKGNSRNRDNHSQFHRALASEHRSYHQYNRIDDWEDRIRHRRFHRYLEAKHRREHRNFCDDCLRWFSIISDHHNDDDNDRNNHRRNTRHDHH